MTARLLVNWVTHPLVGMTVTQGKELSFNNYLDVLGAFALVRDLGPNAIAIIKHNNPCGAAWLGDVLASWHRALKTDPVSAFGGVVAVNGTVSAALAEQMPDRSTLVLAGRSVRLAVARARAAGRLFELDVDDLALSAREEELLLRDAGIALAPDDRLALRQRMEGWAAGTYLAALALRNARLIDELARSRAELERRADSERTLRQIAGRIAALRDPQVVLQTIVDETRRLLGSDGAHLTLMADDGSHLQPVVVAGGLDVRTTAWLKRRPPCRPWPFSARSAAPYRLP